MGIHWTKHGGGWWLASMRTTSTAITHQYTVSRTSNGRRRVIGGTELQVLLATRCRCKLQEKNTAAPLRLVGSLVGIHQWATHQKRLMPQDNTQNRAKAR